MFDHHYIISARHLSATERLTCVKAAIEVKQTPISDLLVCAQPKEWLRHTAQYTNLAQPTALGSGQRAG